MALTSPGARGGDTLVIHEIYASVQGESTFAGLPCAFVRTSGCDLRCSWCDTTEAFTGGTRMRRRDVLALALGFRTPLVEVTGGEPLLQTAVLPLLTELCDAGRTVLLETGGHRDISGVDPRVHRIVDLKPPGSGEHDKNLWQNLDHLGARDELKFVLSDRRDYEWMRDTVERHGLGQRGLPLLVSPVHGELDARELVGWILEDGLPVRLNVQLHKHIWGPGARGV